VDARGDLHPQPAGATACAPSRGPGECAFAHSAASRCRPTAAARATAAKLQASRSSCCVCSPPTGTRRFESTLSRRACGPGDGREGRRKAFDVTVARLRRMLDCDAAVIVFDHRARINGEVVRADVQVIGDHLAQGEAAAAGSVDAGTAFDAALVLYRGACLADGAQPWARAAALRLRERLAAALLRELRIGDARTTQRREWVLRASAADPLLGALIKKEG